MWHKKLFGWLLIIFSEPLDSAYPGCESQQHSAKTPPTQAVSLSNVVPRDDMVSVHDVMNIYTCQTSTVPLNGWGVQLSTSAACSWRTEKLLELLTGSRENYCRWHETERTVTRLGWTPGLSSNVSSCIRNALKLRPEETTWVSQFHHVS